MVARLPKGWTGEEPVRPAGVGSPQSSPPRQGTGIGENRRLVRSRDRLPHP